ncbi:hypothetical protein H6G80_30145 [Nostoc sp. FACHB-87]|uniref:DUF6753 family protein n=1 Tax=Nostocales TaxID=1161 RepID=UPI0016829334|nr:MULTISPECIES: DUF6753 family protein [Nostocales]MBD2303820.1 hypothetical protein [Nostoc sp. FACHB-190]MBD2458316.1 hypothetical protein [Nostoc sp. FACHB-87]MBD2479464.1 hypothetical protein [Anabaena sp. FACHB-83]MBD2491241.1 hypothetical protein [Aulosira sp. FACHB-615]
MQVGEILQGYSEAEQKRISQMCQEMGISRDDPMFQLMATLGRYEETIIDHQARTEAMVEAWATLIDSKLEDTSKAAQSMHYTVISSAVRDVLKNMQNPLSLPENNGKIGVWLWAVIGGVLAAGGLLGSLTTWNVVSNLSGNQTIVVSQNDLKVLQWAKTKEGQQMYQTLLQNQAAIAACQQRKELQGYCLIRVRSNQK